MDEEQKKHHLQEAARQINSGDCRVAYALLEPLLAEKNPEAAYLYSMFSFEEEETEAEFEARSLRLLRESADAGYPPAIFALSEWYVVDGEDRVLASALLKKSVELSYPPAKLTYGLCLFYGEWPLEKDESKGLDLIRQAVAENVYNAKETLEEIEATLRERG
jgi:TPR repeat protein